MSEPRSTKILALGATADEVVCAFGATLAAAVAAGQTVRAGLLDGGREPGAPSAEDDLLTSSVAAPNSFRRLGLAEVWRLPSVEDADLLIARLRRILDAWEPERVIVAAHGGNAALLFALRSALSRSTAKVSLQVAEYVDPLPVTETVRSDTGLAAKQAAIAELNGDLAGSRRLDRAARVRGLRGDGEIAAESFRGVDAEALDADPLWSWLDGSGPSTRSESMPIVSVVVRTKNRPDLLAEALASLRAQTLRSFEVVVVNDGGADVGGVVRAVRDLDVNLITAEPGVGRSAAANLGLRAARGRYLAFLDDDDLFLPHHLQTLVEFLEANQEFAGAYADVEVTELEDRTGQGRRELRRHRPFAQDFDRDLLLFGNYIPIIALVLRREVLAKAGEFRPDLDLLEDWDFLIRVSRAFTLRRIPRVTAEYRVRVDGSNQTRIHPWGSLDETLARVDVARRHFGELSPEAVVRAYRTMMERIFRQGAVIAEREREIEELRRQAVEATQRSEASAEETVRVWSDRVREAAQSHRAADEEAIRRLETECDFLSTELVRRGEALQAQASALQRLGTEIERVSTIATTATREAAGLHREVERREELIRAMRGTRLWRMRDWLRGRF